MNKIIALLLTLAMCLSLCACGKSDAAKAVDELILAIGDVTTNSEAAVKEAEDAYNMLSDKEKETVEYYGMLVEAKAELNKALRVVAKEEEFAALSERLKTLNEQCDAVTKFIYMIWENVGPQNFYTHFNAILMFEDEDSLDAMKAYYATKSSGQNAWITQVWAAGTAINEALYGDVQLGDNATIGKIVDECIAFTSVYKSLSDTSEALENDISAFVKEYKNDYPDETEILRKWGLESSMYAEFAMEPSGSLSSYGAAMATYQDTMSRFMKEANSLK